VTRDGSDRVLAVLVDRPLTDRMGRLAAVAELEDRPVRHVRADLDVHPVALDRDRVEVVPGLDEAVGLDVALPGGLDRLARLFEPLGLGDLDLAFDPPRSRPARPPSR
jgi:CTP:molybdopterin cytidylyltransferase MocA